MKKIKFLALILSFSATLISCRKEVKSDKGGIDMISNVYFKASKGLNSMQTFHVSKINYSNDTIIEFIPDLSFPEISTHKNFIKDSIFYELGTNAENINLYELTKSQKPKLVFNKKAGAIFSKDEIPNYRNRKNLSDTILFKKKYKRFEVNSPWIYTRYYVYKTDTILPYSLYRHAEKDYGGRLERIDSYNKKTDAFVTLQIIPRKNWDDEAEEFFTYNKYIKQSISKK